MPGPLQDITTLFARISNDDISAYEILFNNYYDLVYSTAFKYGKTKELADDVAQQVFLKVWERRSELTSIENPEGWLYTAARYQVMHALDKEVHREAYIKYVQSVVVKAEPSPADQLIRRQDQELLHKAFERLSPRQMEVYRMSRENGMTYEEIADSLGLSRETVKEHIAKALKSIREFIGEHRSEFMTLMLYWMMKNF